MLRFFPLALVRSCCLPPSRPHEVDDRSGAEKREGLGRSSTHQPTRRAFDAIYPALASKYGASLAPPFLSAILDRPDRTAAIAAYIQPDGLHPNAEGVHLIVERLGPSVLKLLKGLD